MLRLYNTNSDWLANCNSYITHTLIGKRKQVRTITTPELTEMGPT